MGFRLPAPLRTVTATGPQSTGVYENALCLTNKSIELIK